MAISLFAFYRVLHKDGYAEIRLRANSFVCPGGSGSSDLIPPRGAARHGRLGVNFIG
jgi:hypothetical protein